MNGAGKRALLADDSRFFRVALSGLLRVEGWEVLEVQHGPSALRVVLDELPGLDLVILQLGMPGLDGVAVLRGLRSREKGSEIPVVTITAGPLPPDQEEALGSLGATLLDKSAGLEAVALEIRALGGGSGEDE